MTMSAARRSLRRGRTPTGLCLCLWLLCACSTDLHGGLSERDANAIVATLQRAGLNSEKKEQKGDVFLVTVTKRDFARAVELMTASGFPRPKYARIADLFQPSGFITTPFESHVRYLYGLSEELAHTISLFEGVLETRVHVVIENREESLSSQQAPGKASIYIKYDPNYDFSVLAPRIRKLVADSLDSVSYENIELVALPARNPASEAILELPYRFFLGIGIDPKTWPVFIALLIGVGGAPSALLLVFIIFLLWRRRRRRKLVVS